MTSYPVDSDGQRIGRLAARALAAKMPVAWIETALSGDTDYGIDYQIQFASAEGNVQYSFYMQLKGTTHPDYDSDLSFINYSLKVSTLNNYKEQEPLVMVAVVDLKGHEDTVYEATIYYKWLDDEWFKENEVKLGQQKTITVKLPTDQQLNTRLDIYDFYSERIARKFALTNLSAQIEPHTNDLIRSLDSLGKTISEKPLFLKAAEISGEEPWIENPAGEIPTLLKECHEAINSNNITKANNLLEKLAILTPSMNSSELAELFLQKGICNSLCGDEIKALEEMDKAQNICKKERYSIPLIELKMRVGVLSDQDIEEMAVSLSEDSFRSAYLKAKCLALTENLSAALELLTTKYPDKIAGKLIILTLSDDPKLLDNALKNINPRDFKDDRELLAYYLCLTRREFYKAHNENIVYDKTMPFPGSSGIIHENMKKSYIYCEKAWEYLKLLGYPNDYLAMLDISSLVHSYFNDLNGLFVHFNNILKERPKHTELIRIYARLLFNMHSYEQVIELLKRVSEDLNDDDKALLFLSYYYIGRNDLALEVFRQIDEQIISSKITNAPLVFCIASEVARESFDFELSDSLRQKVIKFDNGEAYMIVSDFVVDARAGNEKIPEKLLEMYNSYLRLEKPTIIADNLIGFLNENLSEHASIIIDISKDIGRIRELNENEYLKLAKSYLTISNPEEALNIIEVYLKKEKKIDKNWSVVKAVALQQIGKIGLAYEEISKTLESNKISDINLQLYVNLCLQFGLFDGVEDALIRLINTSHMRSEKLSYLSTLILVYSKNPKYLDKRANAINTYGRLVNQNDPLEEGRYLTYLLFNSSGFNENDIAAWKLRLNRYTENFPDSNVLRQAKIYFEQNSEDIVNSLNSVTGITPELLDRWKSNERAIRNGSLPVPFTMLHHFISKTNDIFTTWNLANSSPEDAIELKLHHSPQLETAIFANRIESLFRLFIEDTSLILLAELNILNDLLECVDQFCILSSTFDRLSLHQRNILEVNFSILPNAILNSLNIYREKINIINDESKNIIQHFHLKPVSSNDLFLTDDINIYSLIKGRSPNIIFANSITVIEYLYSKGKISNNVRCELVAKLCSYGVHQPNMSVESLSSTLIYYISENKHIDYTDTGFKDIFDKVFSSLRENKKALPLFFKMLKVVAFQAHFNFTENTLLSLIRGFLLRHPYQEITSFTTLCFITLCLDVEINFESNLLQRSPYHAHLWNIYRNATAKLNSRDISSFVLLTNTVDNIYLLPDEQRALAYKAVESAFLPLTYEHELLKEIFSNKAISLALR